MKDALLEVIDFATKYLSEEQIQEIIEDEFRRQLREYFCRTKAQDIIANTGYRIVMELCNENLGEDFKEKLSEKVGYVINNLSSFIVFHESDVYTKETLGQKILNEVVTESRPKIKERVERIIDEYDFPQLERNEIMFTIADVLTDRLLPSKEEK